MAKIYKVTVNLPETIVQALKDYAEGNGITVTEGLCRAILIQEFVAETVRAGAKLLIEKENGQIREVVFP